MNLTKRLEQLEARLGKVDDFLLIVVSLIGCDPDKIGPERAIRRAPIGYSAASRDRKWLPHQGESLDDLRARMELELRAEGHKAFLVCECYANDEEVSV